VQALQHVCVIHHATLQAKEKEKEKEKEKKKTGENRVRGDGRQRR